MADPYRLRAALTFIHANPDLWRQDSWLHCFAALAVELAGHDVLPSLWVRLDDRSVPVWDAAAEVLDLTGPQARALFAPGNTQADLSALVEEIARPRTAPSHAKRDRHALCRVSPLRRVQLWR